MKKWFSMIIVSFCFASTLQAMILNPGFESVYEGTTPNGQSTADDPQSAMPDDWAWRKQGSMDGSALTGTDLHTEGDYGLYMFASNVGSHVTGDYLEYYQSVDFTNTQTVLFDVYLGEYARATTAYVAIDSQQVWTRDTSMLNQTLIDISIDVSSLTGLHEIALGIEAFADSSANADGHVIFDNLRTIEIPEPASLFLFMIGIAAMTKQTTKR